MVREGMHFQEQRSSAAALNTLAVKNALYSAALELHSHGARGNEVCSPPSYPPPGEVSEIYLLIKSKNNCSKRLDLFFKLNTSIPASDKPLNKSFKPTLFETDIESCKSFSRSI